MNPKIACLLVAVSLALSNAAVADTTQMTGTVLAVAPTSITVQKGKEVWVIKRGPSTKVSGDLKVGATVTVNYNAPDAQKKEGAGVPTPSAPSQ